MTSADYPDQLAALGSIDPSMLGVASAITERRNSGNWTLDSVQWAPDTGTRLAFRHADASGGYVSVQVHGAEVTVQNWRDDPALPGLVPFIEHWGGSATPVRYHPGERAVLSTPTPAGGKTFTKVYRWDAYDRAAAIYRALPQSAPIPRLVAANAEHQTITTVAIEGPTAADSLQAGVVQRQSIARSVGQALAYFHRLPTSGVPHTSRAEYLADLRRAVAVVAAWDVAAADRMSAILDRLPDDEPEGSRVLSHGSIRFGHVVLRPDGPLFLGLDAACVSEPARDLGMGSAELLWQGIRSDEADAWSSLRHAFATGYELAAKTVPVDDLAWWTAGSIVQVAAECYRRLDVAAWPRAARLLDRADEILDGVVVRSVFGYDVVHWRPLTSAPSRQSVAQCDIADGPESTTPVIVKTYRQPHQARVTTDTHDELAVSGFDDGAWQIPVLLGLDETQNSLVFDLAPGEPVLRVDDDPATLQAAGQWLQKLHSSDADLARRLDLAAEEAATARWAQIVSEAKPELAPQADAVARGWRNHTSWEPTSAVPIHKDYRPAHVFVASDTTTVIDLDDAQMGDPALDIAHFCTYLDLFGVSPTSVSAFLAGYGLTGGSRPDRGYTAYTWLKIAKQAVTGTGPFRDADAAERDRAAERAVARGFSSLSA